MKRASLLLLVCMILFTGCSSIPAPENTISFDDGAVQARTASLEKSTLRTYIDVYEGQLLYMEMRLNFLFITFRQEKNKI